MVTFKERDSKLVILRRFFLVSIFKRYRLAEWTIIITYQLRRNFVLNSYFYLKWLILFESCLSCAWFEFELRLKFETQKPQHKNPNVQSFSLNVTVTIEDRDWHEVGGDSDVCDNSKFATIFGCCRTKLPKPAATSKCCHQNISSPTFVTNIDVTVVGTKPNHLRDDIWFRLKNKFRIKNDNSKCTIIKSFLFF